MRSRPGATNATQQCKPIACNRASQQQCNSTAKERCNHVSQQQCKHAFQYKCNDVTMQQCYNVTLVSIPVRGFCSNNNSSRSSSNSPADPCGPSRVGFTSQCPVSMSKTFRGRLLLLMPPGPRKVPASYVPQLDPKNIEKPMEF